MAAENWLWGQKRIQAELARLGFKVSARTVAKYMRLHRNRGPSRLEKILKQHAPNIWACDFFCVHTILFQTLYVFFVIRLANREVLHVEVTRHPTAEWAAQQIVECCAWDRRPPRFLIHDRISRYGMSFDRRVRHLGIRQVRTPLRSPRANAVAERSVKSARTECLDHLFVFGEAHLRRAMSAYKTYYNHRIKPIIIIGARIDHFANVRPTIRECLIFGLGRPAARSSQSLYLADCITFTGAPHDGPYFCALHPQATLRSS